MPVRTTEDLGDLLNHELGWRKRELTTLRFAIERSRPHEIEPFIRAAICLLYAHWEGFVRTAARGYLEFVESRRLYYRELTSNFMALGLRARLIEAGQSKKTLVHTAFVRDFLADLADGALTNVVEAIDTRSNLNFDVLRDILAAVGLQETPYSTKKALVDSRLLGSRNGIAHGERRPMTSVEYLELQREVLELLEQFRTDIENAAVRELYRQSQVAP